MSPRVFIAGASATLALAMAFYAWVMSSLLGMPGRWIAIILFPVAVVLAVGGNAGYRLWRSQLIVPRGETNTPMGRQRVWLYLLAIAVATICTVYFRSRHLLVATVIASLLTTILALSSTRRHTQGAASERNLSGEGWYRAIEALLLDRRLFLAYLICCNATFLLLLIVTLFVSHDVATGVVLSLLFLILLPWGTRKVKREFKDRGKTV